MDKKKIYVKISGFVGLVMTFILLSGISVLATEQQAQGDLIIDTDVDEGYAYVGDGVQLLRGYEIMKGGTYKVSMAEGVTQTNEVILIDSDNPVILELDNVKISSLGLKQYFFGQTSYGTYYGAPAIWIDTNLQTDVTIIYKGDCYLKGSNQWAAIMKYNRDTGGKLTLRSSGSDDDVLKLEGSSGIGSHSDASSMSDNVCIENGRIIGSFGAKGVKNYVINAGFHILENRSSGSSTSVSPGIGTSTINGGTVVTNGPIDSSVITYKGGNLYSKKEMNVIDGNGEEAKLVVFPADEKLTGVVIDGVQSPCIANNSTNYQLYTFMSKKAHSVKLIFTDREEEYSVSFIGDKPIVTGDNTISVTYPDWAIQSIEKAIITGVPESMYYTGKRVTIPDLKVTLDGYELKEDNDYTVTYTNNKEVGRASFSIKGINTYKGTLYGNFEIKKKTEENNNNNNNNNNSETNNNINNNSPNNNTSNNNSTNNDNTNNNSTDNNNDSNNNNNTNNTTEYVPPTPKPTGTTLPKSNYGSYYKVTSSSSSNPTATFTKPANKNTYSVYIDSMVYDAGVYYTVTTISDNAFKGCKSITYLSIPYSINKIGKNAFKDCKKLETFTIYTTKLNSKNVGKNAFKGITKKTKIRVPKSKKKAYTKLFRKKGLSKKVKIVGI